MVSNRFLDDEACMSYNYGHVRIALRAGEVLELLPSTFDDTKNICRLTPVELAPDYIRDDQPQPKTKVQQQRRL